MLNQGELDYSNLQATQLNEILSIDCRVSLDQCVAAAISNGIPR